MALFFARLCRATVIAPLKRALGGSENTERCRETCEPPFYRSRVAGAAPKGGSEESGIPLLTRPGSSGVLPSTPTGTLSTPVLGSGRRQRLAGLQHRHICSLPIAHLPGRKPEITVPRPAWDLRWRAAGPVAEQIGAAAPLGGPPPRVARAREAAGRGGLSPSGPPAHSRALRRGPSARATTARPGLPAPPPSSGAHLAPRRRAPARPPGPYLLRKREERGRHLPADSGSECRGRGRGARVRVDARGGARAAGPRRGRGQSKAAHAQPSLAQAEKGWGGGSSGWLPAGPLYFLDPAPLSDFVTGPCRCRAICWECRSPPRALGKCGMRRPLPTLQREGRDPLPAPHHSVLFLGSSVCLCSNLCRPLRAAAKLGYETTSSVLQDHAQCLGSFPSRHFIAV